MAAGLDDAFRELLGKCTADLQTVSIADKELLERCKTRCEKCLKEIADSGSCEVSKYLQGYAEMVLEYTYQDECKMVEEGFPDSTSIQRIQDIFVQLDEIIDLTHRLLPEREANEVLGQEICECLKWRKGALLYMYCKTVEDDPKRSKDRDVVQFVKFLRDGTTHLEKVIRTNVPSESAESNSDTLSLLSMGIYSETTLLAMMYGGEMCYWHHMLTRQDGMTSTFDDVGTGTRMLKLYTTAVNGPLCGHGWNTDRAQFILQYFSQSS